MTETKSGFDLLTEPWIPCREANGDIVELGLRPLLLRAHELVTLDLPTPLMTGAILRLLLAILHRAYEGPKDDKAWRAIWEAGRFDDQRINRYLDKWADRFDLFHPEYPFMQVAGLGVEKETPVLKLGHDYAAGNNATLFDHNHEDFSVSWTPARVARHLVAYQCFALGGGKSSKSERFGAHPNVTHGPGVGRMICFISGKSVFESLALNLVSYPTQAVPATVERDAPCWEFIGELKPGSRPIRGYTDLLTWTCRAVHLNPEANGHVKTMELASLYATPESSAWHDPLALHRLNKNERKQLRLGVDRAIWRDSSALVPEQLNLQPETLKRLSREQVFDNRLQTVGMVILGLANDKAKPQLWREAVLPFPRVVIEDPDISAALRRGLRLVEVVARALRDQLRSFAKDALKVGEATPRGATVTSFVERTGALSQYWSELDRLFRLFLSSLAKEPNAAVETFVQGASQVATDAWERSTDGAFGRSAKELRLRAQHGGYLNSALRKAVGGERS